MLVLDEIRAAAAEHDMDFEDLGRMVANLALDRGDVRGLEIGKS